MCALLRTLIVFCFAQSPCPPGTEMSGGMKTSGCEYPLACRTPEEKRKGDLFIAECHCGDMGLMMIGGGLTYTHESKWRGDHCESRDVWGKLVKGKWVEISKAEFDRLMNAQVKKTKRRK